MQKSKFSLQVLFLVIVSIVLQGCCFRIIRKNEDRLNKRIVGYWDARVDKNFDKTYSYESEAFKKKKSFELYFAEFFAVSSKLDSYEIKNIEYDEEKGNYLVTVRRVFIVNSPPLINFPIPSVKNEIWIFENGDWYREYAESKKKILPFLDKNEKKEE